MGRLFIAAIISDNEVIHLEDLTLNATIIGLYDMSFINKLDIVIIGKLLWCKKTRTFWDEWL